MSRYAPWIEFAGVVLLAFGYFSVTSLYALFHPAPLPPISEAHLQGLLYFEPPVLLAVLALLRWRGWSFQRVGFRPDAAGTLIGIGLFVATYMIVRLCWLLAATLSPELRALAVHSHLVESHLTLVTVAAASIVNPFYEELLVSGYVMTAVRERLGLSAAINASVAIRLLYHLYQGPHAAISIIPIGLIFAFCYARTGRLWPLVVAHAGLDFFALQAYVG